MSVSNGGSQPQYNLLPNKFISSKRDSSHHPSLPSFGMSNNSSFWILSEIIFRPAGVSLNRTLSFTLNRRQTDMRHLSSITLVAIALLFCSCSQRYDIIQYRSQSAICHFFTSPERENAGTYGVFRVKVGIQNDSHAPLLASRRGNTLPLNSVQKKRTNSNEYVLGKLMVDWCNRMVFSSVNMWSYTAIFRQTKN